MTKRRQHISSFCLVVKHTLLSLALLVCLFGFVQYHPSLNPISLLLSRTITSRRSRILAMIIIHLTVLISIHLGVKLRHQLHSLCYTYRWSQVPLLKWSNSSNLSLICPLISAVVVMTSNSQNDLFACYFSSILSSSSTFIYQGLGGLDHHLNLTRRWSPASRPSNSSSGVHKE